MKKRLCLWLMALCLILLGQAGHRAYAQTPRTIEVGPHFGATSYVGELNVWRNLLRWNWTKFNQFNYDWGFLVRYNYDSRWSFRIDYTQGMIRACDSVTAWRPEADLTFQSTLNDIALLVEFNFLDYYTGQLDNSISPYIFGGFSTFFYETKPFTKIPAVNEETLKKTFAFSIPFGVGCKLSISKHLAATAEWRMHYTFTDELDGVSGLYPDDDAHLVVADYDISDPTGHFHAQQQRGNTQNNDWFGMINLSLTWKFVIPNPSACNIIK